MANKNLNQAKNAKKDEFYTQLCDIENELRHYREHFRGKTVLCNCDDPYESNFFKYFALNFNALGMKKLIATCYNGSPVQGNELMLHFEDFETEQKRNAYKVEITEVTDVNGDGVVNLADVQYLLQNDRNVLSLLKENGDFRSRECIELLKQADIVVTNPPFSLFREYVAQLMEYGKKFLIIGHQNAITYKEIFPLIKANRLWLGYGFKGGASHFVSPYEDTATAGDHRQGMIRVSGVHWFTNLDTRKRHEDLILFKKYVPKDYPRLVIDRSALDTEIGKLVIDSDVQNKKGICPYVLTRDEHGLGLRAFPEDIKLAVYERQKGICPLCHKHYEIEQMEGDHITPWRDGGRTIEANCQMLCRDCNRRKGTK